MTNLRPIIVHHHIFKNAGTSIDFSLKKYFGGKWSALEGEHARHIVTEKILLEFIQNNPGVSAISSHSLRPVRSLNNVLPIIFLRHPILRARSVFLFSKKDKNQPNHQEISRYSFPEYVEWALDSPSRNGGVVIKNYQVIHLSDASFKNKSILDACASNEDLINAKDLIQSLPVYGMVEQFAQSASRYEDYFGKFFYDIKFEDVRLNVTSNLSNDLSEQLKIIQNELGLSTYNKLNDLNLLDLSLYEFAKNHF